MCIPERRKTKVNKTNLYNSDHRLPCKNISLITCYDLTNPLRLP